MQNLGEGAKRGQMGRLGVRKGSGFLGWHSQESWEGREGREAAFSWARVVPLIKGPHVQTGYLHLVAAGVLLVPNHNVSLNIQYSLIGGCLRGSQGPENREGRSTH